MNVVGADGESLARATRGGQSVSRAGKPRVLVIGPTPPPYHGMTTFTLMLLESRVLRDAYEVLHLDTADRRSLENLGRLDLTNVRLGLEHAARLAGLIRRHRPDVVFVQVSQNAWAYLRDALFITLARALGCRVLTHLNGGHFRAFYEATNPFVRFVVRRTSAMLDGAAVLGGGLRPLYAGLVAEDRVGVLPNGVADAFDGRAPERTAGAGPLRVTYLGSIFPEKGVYDLLDAARRLRGEPPGYRFRFAGPFPTLEVEAEARRRAEGAGDVVFAGVVAGAAKRRLLEETDVLALPSAYPLEGQPQVILEAMAAGAAVVSTRRAAIPDMVEDGVTGILVPERDPAALAAALRSLAGDPSLRLRMGRAGRERYLAEFTAERCAARLVELLDEARGTHHRRHEDPLHRRGAPQLREDGPAARGDGALPGARAGPGPHRAALRPAHVRPVLPGPGDPRAGPQPGSRIR